MIFQTLDDKSECVGVYAEGTLHFDNFPVDLTHTWGYSGSFRSPEIEYACLYAEGASLEDVCPPELEEELSICQKKLRAYLKSFTIAKINMRDHCVFDLVPHDFLLRFCEVKNAITRHVFESYGRPAHYEHLKGVLALLHKIKYQKLNLSVEGNKGLLLNTREREKIQTLLRHYHHIDYNLFGTVTGRLTTRPDSFPILTIKKEWRKLLRPNNDLFVCLDYNGAEIRTLIELSGQQQPTEDVHAWNLQNVFNDASMTREDAKTEFFSWLYNPDSTTIKTKYYDRKKILDKWYADGYINTPYARKIAVEERKALNYLLQSTTSDRVLSKAVAIDAFLEKEKAESYISHILHDEIAIDYCDKDRHLIPQIKEIFEDGYIANVTAGKDYFNLRDLNV